MMASLSAFASTAALIDGQTVRIEFPGRRKRDSFGRLLAMVYMGDVSVGAELVGLDVRASGDGFPLHATGDIASLTTMLQDYGNLPPEAIEAVEKQTLRMVVQAVQQYSQEAKQIFDNTAADSDTEVIVLAEDIARYALEVAECYPINVRFAGFIDYKQVRWLPTPLGLFPQVLLVDAKASTEHTRDTLQQSQLPMDGEYRSNGRVRALSAGVPQLEIKMHDGRVLPALSTSLLVHLYYENLSSSHLPYRDLKSIFVISLPHQRLKPIYNPTPDVTIFGQGKHSSARKEKERIRVYYSKLRKICPWRVQELKYFPNQPYTRPIWRDVSEDGRGEMESEFHFIGR